MIKKFFPVIVLCCVATAALVGAVVLSNNNRDIESLRQSSTNGLLPKTTNVDADREFPSFSVVDVDGTTISKDTLKGKPAIIWFTTTWCTPCQIGAQAVSKLHDELGTDSFNVLVIFVDLQEQPSDLRRWREQFARPSWRLAFNNGLAESQRIQFLDSKYLLNGTGIIVDFDTQIV